MGDDFAESFVMSAFQNGILRTMKANYYVEAGDLRVIRPLVFVRERVMAEFAVENRLPVIADNCPACFQAPKERHRTKLLLSGQEFECPNLFPCLLNTMMPLIGIGNAGDDDDDASLVKTAAKVSNETMPLKSFGDDDDDASLVQTTAKVSNETTPLKSLASCQ